MKSQLIIAIDDVKKFLDPLGVDLEIIRAEKDVFKRVALKDEAVNSILINDDTKKEFLRKADYVTRIYRAYLPDPIEPDVGETAYLIRKLAKQIRSLDPDVDITEVMQKVEALLDESVEGFEIIEPDDGWQQYDLSKIDFDQLSEKYKKGRKRTVIEKLKNTLASKIESMIAVNVTRMNYREKLQEIIDEYNVPNVNLDEIFQQLLDLSSGLDDEEKRYIREGLESEEELSVFDLLTKPDMNLSKDETKQVKSIARKLLETLKSEKLVLDWRQKQQTRAGVQLAIKQMLDELPQKFTTEVYNQKCNMVYQYVYDMETVAA